MSAINPNTPESFLGLSALGRVPTIQGIRHLISFLKWRFSLLPPGAYRWNQATEDSPDQGGSEIFISADTPIRTEVVGARPAITVSRSQAAFQGTGLNDLMYASMNTGAQVRSDLIPTNLLINVLSQLPVEAEILAWHCTEQIWTFREEIVRSEPSILYTGARPMISPPSPAGSLVSGDTEHNWCVVVVAIPTYLQHTTTKMPINKRIVQHVSVNAKVVSTAPQLASTTAIQPLQGTSAMQPKQPETEKISAVTQGSQLPQTTGSEASLSEPLTVKIET